MGRSNWTLVEPHLPYLRQLRDWLITLSPCRPSSTRTGLSSEVSPLRCSTCSLLSNKRITFKRPHYWQEPMVSLRLRIFS